LPTGARCSRRLIASQAATNGQQTFSLQGAAVQDSTEIENSTEKPKDPFYAFVVTTFLPLPFIGDLELAPATPDGTAVTIKKGTAPFGLGNGFPVDGTGIRWTEYDVDENRICCAPALLAADQPPPVSMSLGGMTLGVLEPPGKLLGIDVSGSAFSDPHSDASGDGSASVRAELSFEKPGTLQIDIDTTWVSRGPGVSWILDSGESAACGGGNGSFNCAPGPSVFVAITEPGTRVLEVLASIGGRNSTSGRAVTVTFTPSP
jgi:hypothetical protein